MIKESDIETDYQLSLYTYARIDTAMNEDNPIRNDNVCLEVLERVQSLLELTHGPAGSRKTTKQKQAILSIKNAVLLAIRQNRPDIIRGTRINVGALKKITCNRCLAGITALDSKCPSCCGTGVYHKTIECSVTVRLNISDTHKDFIWTFPQDIALRLLRRYQPTWHMEGTSETNPTATSKESEDEIKDVMFVLWFLYKTGLSTDKHIL